jgi:hypothetical protein
MSEAPSKALMNRRTAISVIAALAISGCGNGASAGSEGGTTAAPPGTITGSVVGYRSADRSHTTPEPQVAVTAYTRSFPYIGPVTADRPRPVARAVTDANGHFELDGLTPGRRYFVLFGMATAKWVKVGTDHGASVTAAICKDCPLPM